jgi:anti-sigma B factor antagonist
VTLVTASSVESGTTDLVTIEVTGDSASTVLTAVGEVDSSSAPALRARLDEVLDAGARSITVDLNGVTFLDSAGLCVLAGTHRRATELGVALRVLASDRAVVRPLQITGLYGVLAVEPADPGEHSAA